MQPVALQQFKLPKLSAFALPPGHSCFWIFLFQIARVAYSPQKQDFHCLLLGASRIAVEPRAFKFFPFWMQDSICRVAESIQKAWYSRNPPENMFKVTHMENWLLGGPDCRVPRTRFVQHPDASFRLHWTLRFWSKLQGLKCAEKYQITLETFHCISKWSKNAWKHEHRSTKPYWFNVFYDTEFGRISKIVSLRKRWNRCKTVLKKGTNILKMRVTVNNGV